MIIQLSSKYDFNGTQLASYLEDALQGLPYLILTSYPEDSVDERLVVKNAICDRSIMDKTGEEFNDFCDQLKQMTEVYDNNNKKNIRKNMKGLIKKKQERELSSDEEEELMGCFFAFLKSYKEIDEIPAEMLKSSFSGKMDLILGQLDILLKK